MGSVLDTSLPHGMVIPKASGLALHYSHSAPIGSPRAGTRCAMTLVEGRKQGGAGAAWEVALRDDSAGMRDREEAHAFCRSGITFSC